MQTHVAADYGEERASDLGRRIAFRLRDRDQTRQTALLFHHLNRLAIARHMTLTGSAALHGAYLGKRLYPCIDLLAPYAVVAASWPAHP